MSGQARMGGWHRIGLDNASQLEKGSQLGLLGLGFGAGLVRLRFQ
jgi:hypothetical protein